MITVARERSKLVPLKAMPTGRPTPLTNAAIEIPSVITVDVIKPVHNAFDCIESFHFFGNPFMDFNFIKKKMPQFQLIFVIDMFVFLVVP